MDFLFSFRKLAAIMVCFLFVDSLYLYNIAGVFGQMIQQIQRSPLQINWLGAAVCYLAMTGVLYWFIIKPRRPATDAAILGAAIYAVYESTSYATLKGWNGTIAMIDTVWGGVLFYIVTQLVYWINA
jgi:uncharacterized membrane protein